VANEQVSKANLYGVLAPPVGVNVSKANLYGVLAPPIGVNTSKANLYAVLSPGVAGPGPGNFVQVCS
jgi:hypothetical protein